MQLMPGILRQLSGEVFPDSVQVGHAFSLVHRESVLLPKTSLEHTNQTQPSLLTVDRKDLPNDTVDGKARFRL